MPLPIKYQKLQASSIFMTQFCKKIKQDWIFPIPPVYSTVYVFTADRYMKGVLRTLP